MSNMPLNEVVIRDDGVTGAVVVVNGVEMRVDHYSVYRDVDSTVNVTLRLVGCSLNYEEDNNE